MTQAHPLQWPQARPRKAAAHRKRAKFGKDGPRGWKQELTVADARHRLQRELDMIGARYPVVSSNVELRLDGAPRSGQREPDDPGVCVYFDLNGKPMAMPCDTYDRVADNIAAIAAHMEATRKIERHGVASVSEMFAGFEALPAPGQANSQQWWVVLGLDRHAASVADVKTAYRRLAAERHPDKPGGSQQAMAELNVAKDQGLEAARS
ncbi:DnaJ domain-containing protein [Oricola sp.]|uniref:DnaJ domain-containing protein n=1 Tax=Oricola sp. TaxID=1979950 RepID=UPI0025F383D1|nr:DnaJ domain-containing protein [Oricola sp.]MCI5075630.1 DnaJ domain-containing protein [Oricola sp.]